MTDHDDPLVRTALEELDEPQPDFANGWPDVLHRAEYESPGGRHRRRGRRWLAGHGRVAIAATAATAAAIVVALAVSGPWGGGPTLVDRAAAAISPSENSILHLRQVERSPGTFGQAESWQLGDPLQAMRIVRGTGTHADETSITVTGKGQGAPRGDDTTSVRGLIVGYCPADETLRRAEGVWGFSRLAALGAVPGSPVDPAVRLRAALESGELVDAGRAELEGQTVVKFVGALRDASSNATDEVTYYARPESLLPVRVEWHGAGQESAAIDFTVAERLPATPENRTLLDVVAQHPGAPVVSAIDATGPCS